MPEPDHPCDRPTAGQEATLAHYHTLFNRSLAETCAGVTACFTDDARFESEALGEPLIGQEAIAEHVVRVSEALAGATVRHHTEVQWAHRTARWCWGITGPSGSRRGMDLARFADDDRIELFIVFEGLLPPPT